MAFPTLRIALILTASCLWALQAQDAEDDRVIDLQELLKEASESLNLFRNDMKVHISNVSTSLRTFGQEIKDSIQSLSESFRSIADDMKDVKDTLKNIKEASVPAISLGKELENIKRDTGSIKVVVDQLGSTCCNKKDQGAGTPKDCADVFKSGIKKSGTYRILPLGYREDFEVYCDMETDGGGWTVFQKRGESDFPADFFYKSWEEYKTGFGDFDREFWLGNDHISAISSQGEYQLRIDTWSLEGEHGFAKYDLFRVNDVQQQYRLHVGDYSGNLGDALSDSNTVRFSTKDQDNGSAPKNCAQVLPGAWWYPSNCGTSNLNGNNWKGPNTKQGGGIVWGWWKGQTYSLPFTQMKMRPKDF